ncbi:DUF4397 domain-containing protein [Nubsella zeaxanthinifaciens]|jgi:hypothetical protein|uniref:DUF4397 domain-containing protein n=1 Tax=Nubsella zeaxanthinifaciens TaxID=392412 RepID=UPI000DE24D63|nr:DUF4397 domain-containing protein [Nubsella zeaxanthinifaciens]
MKINTNFLTTRLAVAAAVVLSITSCKKDDDNEMMMNTQVSFVNTVEGSAAQDVYINDLKVNTSAVAYGSALTDISTTSGSKTIAFKNSGSATVTASANVDASANSSQTAFLVKQANGSLAVSTYANDNTTASGKAKVRFINVAPMLSSTINVATSTGTNLISALAFRTASAYQTIDANTNLNVTMSGSLEVTTIAGSELQAGKIYTIWFDSSTTTKAKYHIVVQK